MRLSQYVRRPALLIHRLRRAVYERRHPGEPWMAPSAIRFLEQHLDRSMTALEWGSGRSTTWFAARVRHLTSVEHDETWSERVRSQIEEGNLDNVDYRVVPLDADKESGVIFGSEDEQPAYVRVAQDFADASLDLVVVDGAYRVSCVLAALSKVKPGGLLLVDDEAWFPTLRAGHVPPAWPIVHETRGGVSATTIWRRPT